MPDSTTATDDVSRHHVQESWYEEAQRPLSPALATIFAGQPTQDMDGTGNLYYYDSLRSLAFHWTGNPDHQVEVSQGGDHELPRWAFHYHYHAPKRPVGARRDLPLTLAQMVTVDFAKACTNWIDAKEDAR